jgi:hypothetical protein
MVNNFKESHSMFAIDIVYVTHFSLFLDDKNLKKKGFEDDKDDKILKDFKENRNFF